MVVLRLGHCRPRASPRLQARGALASNVANKPTQRCENVIRHFIYLSLHPRFVPSSLYHCHPRYTRTRHSSRSCCI